MDRKPDYAQTMGSPIFVIGRIPVILVHKEHHFSNLMFWLGHFKVERILKMHLLFSTILTKGLYSYAALYNPLINYRNTYQNSLFEGVCQYD